METSVFGGVDDEEFADASRRFFERVRRGWCIPVVSEITYGELRDAPEAVQRVLQNIADQGLEEVPINAQVEELADAYIASKALGLASRVDAVHVAAATVGDADLILSWNFKHIVNYERIRVFNSVNMLNGYRLIDIRSPLEIAYEAED